MWYACASVCVRIRRYVRILYGLGNPESVGVDAGYWMGKRVSLIEMSLIEGVREVVCLSLEWALMV
jgi:hypothetical protein